MYRWHLLLIFNQQALPMGYIIIDNERLHYARAGTGKHILLAFHGYGETGGSFADVAHSIGDTYITLSFDLPHHGLSHWTQDKPFTARHLTLLVNEVMNLFDTKKVSLIGYSLGGRVCLSMLQLMPDNIDRVVLLASDGLVKDKYYHFFTGTSFGRSLFRHMLTHPAPYFAIINMLRSLRLIDKSRHKFVMRSVGTHQARMFLLQVWPCMAQLMPDQSKIKSIINQYKMPVSIFMGAYDRIMPPSIARNFAMSADTVTVTIIPQGHRLLTPEAISQIAAKLL